VTVTSVENGLKRSVKTDDSGRFSFPQLKPGTYSVKAEADRFEAQQNNTVSAELGQKHPVDFKLNIASASERNHFGGSLGGPIIHYPTSPPTGLLGVGLGGDSTPRMIAFQARLEF
jgi:hypothetical protein